MKCPKCNGDKGQWDIGNYHWYPCGFCHETGEVEDKTIGRISIVPNKELPSGCGMLTNGTLKGTCIFKNASNLDDKPEMPDYSRVIWVSPKLLEDKYELAPSDCGDKVKFLPADKVRELVKAVYDYDNTSYDDVDEENKRWNYFQTLVEILFPEGVEDKEDK